MAAQSNALISAALKGRYNNGIYQICFAPTGLNLWGNLITQGVALGLEFGLLLDNFPAGIFLLAFWLDLA